MKFVRRKKDGRMSHPMYWLYKAMVKRCSNANHPSFANYGARGISVCDRWLGYDGFDNFLKDMGDRPEGKTLDRINNEGDYEPSNCRWATPSEQMRNTRLPKSNSSGLAGVSWNKRANRWRVRIKVNGVEHYLGMYEDLQDAFMARYIGELRLWHSN